MHLKSDTKGYLNMKWMQKIYVLGAFLLSISGPLNGQTFDPVLASKLQHKIDSIRNTHQLKGISASVIYPGMGAWKGVTGFSHLGVPIASDMLFGIASNTKLFTGVLMLKLAENNILQLDDSLHQYLPSYTNIDSNITIRQLLNHTSGLADVTSVPGYPDSILTDPNRVFTASEMMTWAPPPLFAAGTSWDYCNTNYLLAGMIAESATGQSYGQLLRDSVLAPLQLDSTFLDVHDSIAFPVAHPWQAGSNNHLTPRTSLNSAAWAAGAMYSTSGEMVHWYDALMNGQVLNANSFNELTTFVGSGNYGMGISQEIVAGRSVWTHGGTIWGGYNSSMMYDTASGIIICVLINQLPAQAFQVSIQLLSTLINTPIGLYESTDEHFSIYPNPSNDLLSITWNPRSYSVEVIDLTGRVMITTEMTTDRFQLDVSSLSQGVYLLKAMDKESGFTEILKFLKE